MHDSILNFDSRSSCLFPQCLFSDSQRSFSYDKLPQMPFRLTVLKLDGSSFGIEVSEMGTVGDVKHAVERAFQHLPPGRVSWVHVWGHFCLCFHGFKLLKDNDCIRMFGINDGDQLQFTRHDPRSYNLVRAQSEKVNLDLDIEPSVSNGHREEPQNDETNYHHRLDIEDNWDAYHTELDNSATSKRLSSLSHLLGCWFPYRKLSRSQMRTGKRSSSLKVPYSNSGSSKNVIRFHNRTNSRRETWKA